jgi:hypothetical protein
VEQKATRLAALRTYAMGLRQKCDDELLQELSGMETQLNELKLQGAEHHRETLEQLDGLHTKVDELTGAGGAFLRVLETGDAPPRPAGQMDHDLRAPDLPQTWVCW